MLVSTRILTAVILTVWATTSCQVKTDRPTVDVASSSLSNLSDCRTIQHEMGETEVCGQPQRIVVLGPYVLEYLLSLEVQPVGYADHVAFHQGDYTKPSQQIPYLGEQITQPIANVGTADLPFIEAIVKVQPDLILGIDDVSANQYETLSKIAPTLLLDRLDPEHTLTAIALAVNRSQQVEQLLTKIQQQITRGRETFAPLVATHPQVLLLGSSDFPEVYLENSDNSCSSLIKTLGFQRVSQSAIDNAGSDAAIPLSLETLPEFNDADLVILFGSNFNDLKQFSGLNNFEDHQLSKLRQAWKENAIAQSIDASKAGKVYFAQGYLCASLPGPIGTELYLEALKEQLLSEE